MIVHYFCVSIVNEHTKIMNNFFIYRFMKYLKKFENNSNAKEGDYVICRNVFDDDRMVSQRWEAYNNFLDNNVGQIIHKGANYFIVIYDGVDIPIDVLEFAFFKKINMKVILKSFKFYAKSHLFKFKNGISNLVSIQDEDIVEYSNSREDLEAILSAKKYNL